jgi:hypothetical protein
LKSWMTCAQKDGPLRLGLHPTMVWFFNLCQFCQLGITNQTVIKGV